MRTLLKIIKELWESRNEPVPDLVRVYPNVKLNEGKEDNETH